MSILDILQGAGDVAGNYEAGKAQARAAAMPTIIQLLIGQQEREQRDRFQQAQMARMAQQNAVDEARAKRYDQLTAAPPKPVYHPPLRTSKGFYDESSGTYLTGPDGKPLMPYSAPRALAASPVERSARAAARSSRADAQAYASRASGFERVFNNPELKIAGTKEDTADFPALRDSATMYRAKSDSARAAAAGYDSQADRAAGLNVSPVPGGQSRSAQPSVGAKPQSGGPPATKAPRAIGDAELQQIITSLGGRNADPLKVKAEVKRRGYSIDQ